ncbi:hypothetical protein F5X68DRAFT_250411 [Plectosphaerella plurivora]|uniref:Transmembrane protein n=1 Tax=Plectosphaerella plurivora TaxID=936078 RepID=A0A9P8VIK6_9PEZI|nr:hypothetical protein F5X68DRAFT_250411 [Plectosphaerella plurivora]
MTSNQPQRPPAAYIVQHHEEDSSRSTIHITSTPLAPLTAWQKLQPQVTDTPTVEDDESPSPAPEPPQSLWQRYKSSAKAKKQEKESNATKRRYDDMWQAGLARWISSIVVLGLAAGIISKGPGSPLLEITAINLACASLHFFLLGPVVAPRSPTDPRPPPWYLAVLAVSSVMWTAVSAAMFAVLSYSDEYVVVDLDKRSFGGVVASGIGAGVTSVELLKNLTVGCACCGVAALMSCLLQWWYVYKLFTKPATEEDVRDCYARLNKKKPADK